MQTGLAQLSDGWTGVSSPFNSRLAVCNNTDEVITVISVGAHFLNPESSETPIGRFNSTDHGSPTWVVPPGTTLQLTLDDAWDGSALFSSLVIRADDDKEYPLLTWHPQEECVGWPLSEAAQWRKPPIEAHEH